MTPAQVVHIMSLLDQYVRACKGVTNYENVMAAKAVRDKLEAALRDAPQQAIPAGTRVVDRGFRFDGEKQQHVPQLVIEFEPAPVNSGHGAKGWKDRDYVAALLTTCDCPAKDMPFGRCCKATPSAPTAVEPDERAMFEAWLVDNRFDASIVDGQYTAIFTRNAWLAWQARASKGTP